MTVAISSPSADVASNSSISDLDEQFESLIDEMETFLANGAEIPDDFCVKPEDKQIINTFFQLCQRIGAIDHDALERPMKRKTKATSSAKSKSKSKSKAIYPTNPWKRFLDLATLPELTPLVQEHINSSHSVLENAASFLNHQGFSHSIPELQADQTGDAFLARYQWTTRKTTQQEQCSILLLFGHLFWFDLVQLIRPEGSGRVGSVMQSAIEQLLAKIVNDDRNGGLNVADVTREVSIWSLRGKKLDILCQSFGPGFIFYFHEKLSNDFLDNKFTGSGGPFDAAIDYIRNLDLEECIASTGVGALGEEMRKILIAPFREAVAKQTATE